MTSLTGSVNKIKQSYGGSDKSSPSFLRPEHVKYNTPAKAKNLGIVFNLNTTLTGTIGSEAGTNTLYFKVTTSGESDLRVVKNALNKYTDQYISFGLLNEHLDQIRIQPNGFGCKNDIHNTDELESNLQLPKGTYYVSVCNSQWQELPFSVSFQVIRYLLLDGTATGRNELRGRIGLVKLFGDAIGVNNNSLTFTPLNKLDEISGTALGQSEATGELTIMKGTIIGRMVPYGRLKMYWRVSGTISGSSANVATLTSTAPYGGGY